MSNRLWCLVLLLLVGILIGTGSAQAVTEPQMDQTIFVVKPGETVHFSYSVPEDFVVESERWYWFFSFTVNDYGAAFFNDDFDNGSINLQELQQRVSWDEAGTISSPETCMICVRVVLNGSESDPGGITLSGFVGFSAPEEMFEYEVTNGRATITGRHDALLPRILVIPQTIGGYPVTAIGDRAFYDMPSGPAGWIFIPDSVTSIGEEAFAASAYITSVRLPAHLTQMGKAAFGACLQMSGIRVPDSLTCIPEQAFANCWNIGNYAATPLFQIIGPRVTSIGARAFIGCQNLRFAENTDLPESIIEIGEHAFEGTALDHVTLPSGITQLADGVFRGCQNLSRVTVAGDLTSIGDAAFENCIALESFRIPASVSSIGANVFHNCPALTAFEIEEGNTAYQVLQGGLLTADGTHLLAYAANSSYESFIAPEMLSSAEPEAFQHLRGLKYLTFPVGFSDYTVGMFEDSTSLVTIQFGENTFSEIPKRFFYGCTSLTEPSAFSGVNSIGESAFQSCSSLASLHFDNALTTISEAAFRDCTSLTHIDVGESLDTIASMAFSGCTNLEIIELPRSLHSISGLAFNGCAKLSTVKIWPDTGYIDASAFMNCDHLTILGWTGSEAYYAAEAAGLPFTAQDQEPQYIKDASENGYLLYAVDPNAVVITIPSVFEALPVIGVQPGVFASCKYLKEIKVENDHASLTVHDGMLMDSSEILLICYPARRLGDSLTIPDGVTEIADYAFANCQSLSQLYIGDSVQSIGEHAFDQANPQLCLLVNEGSPAYLWAVERGFNYSIDGMPSGATGFDYYIMDEKAYITGYSGELTEILVPAVINGHSVYAIESMQNTNLTRVTLGDGIVEIRANAFNCGSDGQLTRVMLPDSLTTISECAFAGQKNLSIVSLGNGLLEIGTQAFVECSHLYHVSLPASLTTIGDYAFQASGLIAISIPANVKTISQSAFSDCKSLESVSIEHGVEQIGDSAFAYCSQLTDVYLPVTVSVIGTHAFEGCSALKTVGSDAAISQLGASAFNGCSSLQAISIAEQITEIPDYAFAGCTKLARVSPSTNVMGIALPHVQRIGAWAFQGCKAARTVDFGDSLLTIGELAFDSTTLSSFVFPDTVTEIGSNAIWRNTNVTHVRLPAHLAVIPRGMFSYTPRLQTLSIPDSVKEIGSEAFGTNVSLGALRLPNGVEKIDSRAFYHVTMLLEIPASVTDIADDAFMEATVEFFTPEGSTAHAYAVSHNIPVHLDQSLTNNYLRSASEMASDIVSQTVTADMTTYQKAEALVDWMLANIALDDNLADTYSGKMALVQHKGSRWGWAFAYKALLNAANITNDIYFNAEGIVENEAITTSGAVNVSYFSGDAINMIQIDGQWYFTHPAFIKRFGKPGYFMLNRELYMKAFNDDPNVSKCDHYVQTFLYQEYSKKIEDEVVEEASAAFESGRKLVWSEVSTDGIPYSEQVLNYAGQHMDTLAWNNQQGSFEPFIIGTESGFWLSDDLTGETAEVSLTNGYTYNYGTQFPADPAYNAVLCGLPVDGTLTLTEMEQPVSRNLKTTLSINGKDANVIENVITKNKVYQAVYTPMLCEYIPSLQPTEFLLTIECKLPNVNDDIRISGNQLIIDLSPEHVFPENAQLDIVLVPYNASLEQAVHILVDDNETLYEGNTRTIVLESDELRCDIQYVLSIARTAPDCIESDLRYISDGIRGPHKPGIAHVIPAVPGQDGEIGETTCPVCGQFLANNTMINSEKILKLPNALHEIQEEAFYGIDAEQINIPSMTTTIGAKAFANCSHLLLVIIPDSVISIADDAFGGTQPVIYCNSANQYVIDWAHEQGFIVYLTE